MTIERRMCVALVAIVLSCSCASKAPGIHHAIKVKAFCGTREGRMTGVASVMTSTNDRLLDETPTETEVVRAVSSGDGLIAYWNDQLLALPNVAKQLGEADGYVRVDAAAVPPVVDTELTRRLYLLLNAGGRKRWVALTAFDTQDVCVEGHRDV